MVTANTNPSSSLASLFGKVITHHQNQKVEQIKGSASLTHSYIRPQPSQDPPALHQDNDQGKKEEKGEGSTFLKGTNPSVQAGKARSSLAATSSQRSTREEVTQASRRHCTRPLMEKL